MTKMQRVSNEPVKGFCDGAFRRTID